MNKILAGSLLLGITAIMIGSILPVTAAPPSDKGPPLLQAGCDNTGDCLVYVDKDRNGICSEPNGDKIITLPKQVVDKLGLDHCPPLGDFGGSGDGGR